MYTYDQSIEAGKSKAPDLLNYESATQYLLDYYNYRKNKDESFSYEKWAAESGIKSRAYLRLVGMGQRSLTDEFIETYSKFNNFSQKEKEHFSMISQMSNATQDKIKKVFKNSLLEKHEINHYELEADEYKQFLESPMNLILQVLTGFKDCEATLDLLSDAVGQDQTQILASLKKLEKLKLVQPLKGSSGNFFWRSLIRPFKIKDEFANTALTKFHVENLKIATNKVLEDDPLSHYRMILLSASPEQIYEMKEDFEDFLRKMKSKYASDQIRQKHLFQINLQGYTVTKKME